MSDTRYNGWTNYATWRVNLEMFDGMTASDIMGRDAIVVSELAQTLRDSAEDTIAASSDVGIARDYAMAFLSDVNWYEIANNMIEE